MGVTVFGRMSRQSDLLFFGDLIVFYRLSLLLVFLTVGVTDSLLADDLEVFPTDVALRYSTDLQRLVAVLHTEKGSREVTTDVTYDIANSDIVEVGV